MRLQTLLNRKITSAGNLLETTAVVYHGSQQDEPIFTHTHVGHNSTVFGSYDVTRYGTFFSNNPQFSALYGKVGKYQVELGQVLEEEMILEQLFRYGMTLDAHGPEREHWLNVSGITRHGRPWQAFDEEIGQRFVPYLIEQGYDSAQFTEDHEHVIEPKGIPVWIESLTTVVFDPSRIRRLSPHVDVEITADQYESAPPIMEMPGWMDKYPKQPAIPDPIDDMDVRKYRRIASNGKIDLWLFKDEMDVIITPTGKSVRQNIGYVRLHNLETFSGSNSYQAKNFGSTYVVTDIYLEPDYRGGTGTFIYKSLLQRGLTLASSTSVNPNSQGVWRKLVADPEVAVWAMHRRGSTAYPLKDQRGRLEPQVPVGGDDVTYENSIWFASMQINPLNEAEVIPFKPKPKQTPMSEPMATYQDAIRDMVAQFEERFRIEGKFKAYLDRYLESGYVPTIDLSVEIDHGRPTPEEAALFRSERLKPDGSTGWHIYDNPGDSSWMSDDHAWVPDGNGGKTIKRVRKTPSNIYYTPRYSTLIGPKEAEQLWQNRKSSEVMQRYGGYNAMTGGSATGWTTFAYDKSSVSKVGGRYDIRTHKDHHKLFPNGKRWMLGLTQSSPGDDWYQTARDENEFRDLIMVYKIIQQAEQMKRQGGDVKQIGMNYRPRGTDMHISMDRMLGEAYADASLMDRKKSFFSDHAHLLMPIVKGLMKTAARPLVYKVWKSTPKAVMGLAAIIKLHQSGDPHPFITLTQLVDMEVPMIFIKRLAWDSGLRDIPGLGRQRPGLMPHMMTEARFIPTQGDQRHHHHRVGDDAVMVWMDPRVFLKQAPGMGPGYDPEQDEMVQHWAEWLRDGRPLDGLELGGDSGHDGRHRAWGAILAGVAKVPVYVEPDMAEFYVENEMAELTESIDNTTVYHVTERSAAKQILKSGFLPGWGDLGYGVYFFGTIESAEEYATDGGWDGRLKSPTILAVRDARIQQVTAADMDPSWDPNYYGDMWWVQLEDTGDDDYWVPQFVEPAFK